MAYLFYNLKCVSLYPLPLFHPPYNNLSSGNHYFVLCTYTSVPVLLFICLVCFLDTKCKWNQKVFVFPCLTFHLASHSLCPSTFVTNIKIQSLLKLSNTTQWCMSLCVYVCKLHIFFFYFTILYWFCHTSTWIRHGCT